MSTSPPPPGEYRSTYTSRSPSSTALPSLPFTSEHSPLLAAHLDRGLSRSRSLPRGEGVETVVGDEDDDEGSTEEERPWWKGGRGAEGARGEQGGLRGARAKKRLGVLKARSRYYIPVLAWLPTYNLNLLAGDMVAGITLACLLIPQGISYASQLGHLSPISGLYSAAVPALLYAVLGTCRQLSVGPEAALSLLVGNTIMEVVSEIDRDPHHPLGATAKARIGVEVATCMGLQVGVITFCLGLFRLGFLDVVLSRALLRGFITAVGVVICVEQSIGMLGLHELLAHLPEPPTTTVGKFEFLVEHIPQTHKLTAMVSFATLAFLITARVSKKSFKDKKGLTWLKYVPEIFVGVCITTFLTSRFGWDKKGLLVLGKIEGLGAGRGSMGVIGFPLSKYTLKHATRTLTTSAVISVIGFVDSIVAAKENSSKYGYSISPNRELVALGAANIAGSFFPGLVPGFGSLTRSRLNGQFGARTQMSGVFTALSIFFAIGFLLPYLHYLPKCVLSSIVLLVVWGIIIEVPHEILFYYRVRAGKDFAQMLGTFLLTLFVGVETGLVASVAFSLILVVQNSTQTRIKILGHLGDEWVPIDENPEAEEDVPGVLVIRIRESLNFANTGQIKERLRRLELYGPNKVHPSEAPRREEATVVVIHMSDVESIDSSAIAIFLEITEAYLVRGVHLFFTHLHPDQLALFRAAGIVGLLGESHFQDDVGGAIRVVEERGLGSGVVVA